MPLVFGCTNHIPACPILSSHTLNSTKRARRAFQFSFHQLADSVYQVPTNLSNNILRVLVIVPSSILARRDPTISPTYASTSATVLITVVSSLQFPLWFRRNPRHSLATTAPGHNPLKRSDPISESCPTPGRG